ncbi:MAG: hypothetical protein J6T01_00485 [Kiritimatiellae bacterium]|nr:hypothetical protein [Kiritimatiellia bacterium]
MAYLEKMLEIMPDDRTTLEFLVVAYEQLGQHEKGQKALVSLTKLLIRDNDIAALEGLLPRLKESDYEPAKVLALKVARLTAPAPDLTPEQPKELTEEEKAAQTAKSAVAAELALADILKEGGVLTEEQHANLRVQVESIPTDGRVFLISAIQILEKENSALAERAIEYLADHFGAPPVPVASFEMNRELAQQFPEALLRIRGVVPFAKIGGITLVATLDPADDRLRTELTGAGQCRFFISEASAVEKSLAKLFTASAEEG